MPAKSQGSLSLQDCSGGAMQAKSQGGLSPQDCSGGAMQWLVSPRLFGWSYCYAGQGPACLPKTVWVELCRPSLKVACLPKTVRVELCRPSPKAACLPKTVQGGLSPQDCSGGAMQAKSQFQYFDLGLLGYIL
jgi:hypothetical protein